MSLFGIGYEVYIICVLLGIPVFFLSKYISKKLIKEKKNQMIGTWLATIILTPIIYCSIVLFFVFCVEYYPNNDFDKDKWKADKEKRYELTKDLIGSKLLIGMTKDQVRATLGDEENINDNNDWYYEIGYKPELFNIDPNSIHITFEKNRVVEVFEH
ncbi:hypothetical protein BEL04_20825 [Mucilaginibacter sp. PPCGB 2223]|nr:hypothetical protein BEL04_20825 [Mucilaginibacter sp. PPCGB 2223]